ncbi:myb-like protein Z, partial [Drosophila navojoa]
NTNNTNNNNSSSNTNNKCNSNSCDSSGLGGSNRSIWSRSQSRPICDDFAERPLAEVEQEMERSCGYHTCSSAASTPTKHQLRRTQDMELANRSSASSTRLDLSPDVGNLEWEMYMMQHAQRIMPKTSSPVCQRRDVTIELNSRSYHKWRNYLQSTPAHMLHNVSHIPEAIAGHFCPVDFPAFTDLEGEMESAAKRFKVDTEASVSEDGYPMQPIQFQTHTISTDL